MATRTKKRSWHASIKSVRNYNTPFLQTLPLSFCKRFMIGFSPLQKRNAPKEYSREFCYTSCNIKWAWNSILHAWTSLKEDNIVTIQLRQITCFYIGCTFGNRLFFGILALVVSSVSVIQVLVFLLHHNPCQNCTVTLCTSKADTVSFSRIIKLIGLIKGYRNKLALSLCIVKGTCKMILITRQTEQNMTYQTIRNSPI